MQLLVAGGGQPLRQFHRHRGRPVLSASCPRLPYAVPHKPLWRARQPAEAGAALGYVGRRRAVGGFVNGGCHDAVVVHKRIDRWLRCVLFDGFGLSKE